MLNGFAYCRMEFAEGQPRDFTYLAVNPAFERLTGLRDVVGKRVSAVIPGIRESSPDLFEAYGRVSLTGAPEQIETWVETLGMWFAISIYSPRKKHFVAVFDVITDRKTMQQELELLSAFPTQNPYPVLRVDRRGKLLYSNPAGRRPWAGWDVMGGGAMSSRVAEAVLGAADGETLRTMELKDGETAYAFVAVPIAGQDYINVYGFDVTERKRVEETLRQAQGLNLALTQHLPHRVFAKDRNSIYLFSNANYARDLGIDAKSIVGMDDFAFYSRELAEAYRADDLKVMAEGKERFIDEPYTVAGEERWIHTVKIPYRNEQGEIVGVLGLFEDITERRRAEETSRLQGAALMATADAVVITDRAGIIEWVNPAFTRLTGYTAEEAVGRNPRDLVRSEKQPPAVYKDLWDTILDGRTWHGEMINRRKDGSVYTEYQTVTPIVDATGAITHFVAIKRDISERLQLEAQFRQAQKMEGVGQLTSGIAHDFNNLLTVINGTSDILLEQIDAGDAAHEDVAEIRKAGERASRLTRQLLAFSRQQVLAPQVLRASAVVADMASLLERLLGEDVDLAIVAPSDAGSVHVDVGQLEQVIVNLAVNARDAMPQGGRLTIETENISIGEADTDAYGEAVAPGSYVRLVVSDTGAGMDEVTRLRIFEPFFTTKGPGKGTGLGLSTVFGIIKQSGGFIRVYSEVGTGSRFAIYLPQVPATGAIDRPAPAKRASTGTETILLVDDSDGLRRLSTRVLRSAGYTVLEAASGDAALEAVARHDGPVHLVLTDVVMPGISGRRLVEQLAETSPAVKVMYMSGYTSDAIVRHGVLEAQVPFIEKPFAPSALLKKVREVLDTGGPIQPGPV